MKKKVLLFSVPVLLLILVIGGIKDVRAEIPIWGDKFTVTGFLRYELGIHTAGKNPNNINIGNHDFTLSRTFFQTEWTFKPTDKFKLYSKIRLTGDQTYHIDSELHRYNAFPVDVPDDDWTMMKASTDDFRAEVWELYGDITLGNLWLRLGKQQIVWGEMIATRLMDQINPLDFSWNLQFEPEEFENIRIPNWALRFDYEIKQNLKWLQELSIEGYINPGDVLPNQFADYGAPFNTFSAFPPFFKITEKDRRGNTEYGFRVGGMIGGLYTTLNYLHVYSDGFSMKTKGLVPDPVFGIPILAPRSFTRYSFLIDKEYPLTEIYGLTCNYFFGGRVNTVATFEGIWVPNQPYAMAGSRSPAIRDQGTFSYALRLNRTTFLLPRPTSGADVSLQFSETVREGDVDRILGPSNSRVDKSTEMLTFQVRQPLWYNNIEASMLVVYDLDGAHLIKPGIKYAYGDHWYFNLFVVAVGGGEKRPGRFGSMTWADEVVGRVTFQF